MAYHLEVENKEGIYLGIGDYRDYFSAMSQLKRRQNKNPLGNYRVIEYPPQIPKSHTECDRLLKELKGE